MILIPAKERVVIQIVKAVRNAALDIHGVQVSNQAWGYIPDKVWQQISEQVCAHIYNKLEEN